MNKQERSYELCRLMKFTETPPATPVDENGYYYIPYSDSDRGRAQFAAILLKFPEVMERFYCVNEMNGMFSIEPTQANILDEILRMVGVEVKDE